MNKAFLTIGIILMAALGFYAVSVVTSEQTGSELDYYLLKETTEASMNDALDTAFYRKFGTLRMDKEKFMESFVKRFAVNVEATRDYTIKVYDLNETPPKVSVKIESKKETAVIKGLNSSGKEAVDITTNADMIIEDKNKTNEAIKTQNKDYAKDLKIQGITFSTNIN